MPRASASAVVVDRRDKFNLANALGVAIISLLATMIGTGVVSMISLHTSQATLTEQVKATSEALAKHLDHSVNRDEYLRRDKEIQSAIESMATKEELHYVRQSLDAQTQALRDLQTTLNNPRTRR